MELYFSPLACSLAARIALYEAGAEAKFVEVDPRTKLTDAGADYRAIHPLALVPALRTDEGDLVTENAAILQYVAERFPAAQLAPTDLVGRARLRQWISFIGTELHKALYYPQFDRTSPNEAKEYAVTKAHARLAHLAAHLETREHLLDRYSVADGYLFTVLNWSAVAPIDLKPWPAIGAYHARIRERPHVARAFNEERALYARELARHAAA